MRATSSPAREDASVSRAGDTQSNARCILRLASLGYSALRHVGVTTLARWLRRDGVVLCYHNVVARQWRGAATLGLHIPVATFERQIRWLVKHYAVVPLPEFVERAQRGASQR